MVVIGLECLCSREDECPNGAYAWRSRPRAEVAADEGGGVLRPDRGDDVPSVAMSTVTAATDADFVRNERSSMPCANYGLVGNSKVLAAGTLTR